MLKLARKFWNDEQGLEFSEYAVMLALIIAVVGTLIGVLATAIGDRFNDTATVISTGVAP
jgi:Flp pilus assembly pilin Flp